MLGFLSSHKSLCIYFLNNWRYSTYAIFCKVENILVKKTSLIMLVRLGQSPSSVWNVPQAFQDTCTILFKKNKDIFLYSNNISCSYVLIPSSMGQLQLNRLREKVTTIITWRKFAPSVCFELD